MTDKDEKAFVQTLISTVKWQIKDFKDLSIGNCNKIASTAFSILNDNWEIWLYPEGIDSSSKDYVSLALQRVTGKNPLSTSVTFSIKVNNNVIQTRDFEKMYEENISYWGLALFLKRSQLLKNLTLPENAITVECSVRVPCNIIQKDDDSTQTVNFLDNCTKILTKNLEDMYLSHNLSDVKIKVGTKEYSAHKAILAARSPVFASMFEHGMTENLNGIIEITNCDGDCFELFLKFLYTGHVDKATNVDSLGLYQIAHKYCTEDLQEICCHFMIDNLEIVYICDVLELAMRYDETELLSTAIDFFSANSMTIFATEQWEKFNLEHTPVANKILRQMSTKASIKPGK